MDMCIECNRIVTGRQQALECDYCDQWQHRICGTGLTLQEKAPFSQLWSIHAFVKHGIIVKQVPLMFCLMSSRIKIDYDGVLRHLLTLLGQPCVQIVTSDFEVALWQSVRGVMPHVRLVGCLFHYT